VFDQIIARLSEVGQLSDSTLGVIIVGGRLTSIALPDAPVAVTAKLFLNVLKQGVLCNLEELNLSNARHVDTNVICTEVLARSCKHSLRKLWLANTRTTNAAVNAVARHCSLLESLDLSGTDIDGACLATVGTSCGGLTHLNLARTSVDDGAVAQLLFQEGLKLTRLDIGCCRDIGSQTCHALAMNPHSGVLAELNIDGSNVTRRDLQSLADNCPGLQSISVLGCAGLSRAPAGAAAGAVEVEAAVAGPLYFPELQTLRADDTFWATHARRLAAPSLEHLTLESARIGSAAVSSSTITAAAGPKASATGGGTTAAAATAAATAAAAAAATATAAAAGTVSNLPSSLVSLRLNRLPLSAKTARAVLLAGGGLRILWAREAGPLPAVLAFLQQLPQLLEADLSGACLSDRALATVVQCVRERVVARGATVTTAARAAVAVVAPARPESLPAAAAAESVEEGAGEVGGEEREGGGQGQEQEQELELEQEQEQERAERERAERERAEPCVLSSPTLLCLDLRGATFDCQRLELALPNLVQLELGGCQFRQRDGEKYSATLRFRHTCSRHPEACQAEAGTGVGAEAEAAAAAARPEAVSKPAAGADRGLCACTCPPLASFAAAGHQLSVLNLPRPPQLRALEVPGVAALPSALTPTSTSTPVGGGLHRLRRLAISKVFTPLWKSASHHLKLEEAIALQQIQRACGAALTSLALCNVEEAVLADVLHAAAACPLLRSLQLEGLGGVAGALARPAKARTSSFLLQQQAAAAPAVAASSPLQVAASPRMRGGEGAEGTPRRARNVSFDETVLGGMEALTLNAGGGGGGGEGGQGEGGASGGGGAGGDSSRDSGRDSGRESPGRESPAQGTRRAGKGRGTSFDETLLGADPILQTVVHEPDDPSHAKLYKLARILPTHKKTGKPVCIKHQRDVCPCGAERGSGGGGGGGGGGSGCVYWHTMMSMPQQMRFKVGGQCVLPSIVEPAVVHCVC
jgi:hypothetical protein